MSLKYAISATWKHFRQMCQCQQQFKWSGLSHLIWSFWKDEDDFFDNQNLCGWRQFFFCDILPKTCVQPSMSRNRCPNFKTCQETEQWSISHPYRAVIILHKGKLRYHLSFDCEPLPDKKLTLNFTICLFSKGKVKSASVPQVLTVGSGHQTESTLLWGRESWWRMSGIGFCATVKKIMIT